MPVCKNPASVRRAHWARGEGACTREGCFRRLRFYPEGSARLTLLRLEASWSSRVQAAQPCVDARARTHTTHTHTQIYTHKGPPALWSPPAHRGPRPWGPVRRPAPGPRRGSPPRAAPPRVPACAPQVAPAAVAGEARPAGPPDTQAVELAPRLAASFLAPPLPGPAGFC